MEGNHRKLHILISLLSPELDARWIETNGYSSSASQTSAAASDSKSEEELHNGDDDDNKRKKNNNIKNNTTTNKNKNKKKMTEKRRRIEPRVIVDEQPPPMPEPMRQKIQELMGNDNNNNNIKAGPTWLQSKMLEESDIIQQKNRLFLPNKEKLNELLSEQEQESLIVDQKTGRNGGMRSGIVDGNGRFWPLDFKMWLSLHKYVLTKEWMRFVRELNLRVKDLVQIWCFRDANWQFCFGINVISRPSYGSCSNGEREGEAADNGSGRSKRIRNSNEKCNGERRKSDET